MRALHLAVALALSVSARAQTPPPLLARPPESPTHTVTLTGEERWKHAIAHPTPRYPIEARRQHITGKGFYHLHVSSETGEVTSVEILKSAGHRVLDRFRRHHFEAVEVPSRHDYWREGADHI
jgi:outer membrane biosynthesis protein TonB